MIFANADGNDTSVYWLTNFSGGWVHLLPALAGKRLLCLSPHDAVGWMLAQASLRVTRIEDPALPVPAKSVSTVCDSIGLDEIAARSEGAERWDGLVVHDPRGLWLTRANLPRVAKLLGQLSKLLSADAFVYVAAANRWSPFRRAGDAAEAEPNASDLPLPQKVLRGLLSEAGWPTPRRHPMLTFGSRILQVLPEQGYRSSKNSERLRERAKQWLLGRIGAGVMAPAYAFVSLRSGAARTVIDDVVERSGRLRAADARTAPVLKEYLVLAGNKAIVSCGPPGDDRADVVTVLCADTLAIERRVTETGTLHRLAELGPELAPFFPQPLAQFEAGSAQCFAISRIPGVTVDQVGAALETVTDESVDFLIGFHRRTTERVEVDRAVFDRHALPLLDAAIERNPRLADGLRRWEAPLRERLAALHLPLVWMHGDYKVENVMYDPRTRKLTGVIDWEHAILPGLPLLDLLYLLLFNRFARGGHWLAAVQGLCVTDDLRAEEAARLQRYCRALEIPNAALPALMALFFAHHIGVRWHLFEDDAVWAGIGKLVADVGAMLAGPASAPRTA